MLHTILLIAWALASTLVFVATLFSALPGSWWVLRVCDFPRAQLLWVALCLLTAGAAAAVFLQPPLAPLLGVGIPLALAAALQTWWTLQFTRVIAPEVPAAAKPPGPSAFRFITANVDYTNPDPAGALAALLAHQPQILALVETDENWAEPLEHAPPAFQWRITDLRPEGHGIALLSTLPVLAFEIRELVTPDRPSIWADIQLPSGIVATVVVLHPPPPGLPRRRGPGRVSSRPRDIELHIVAETIARKPDHDWILAGDLNDVGWSRSTVHAKHTSSLRDPRTGRGVYSTYPANRPFCRFPIDHLLVSARFRIHALRRLGPIGSDHLPFQVDLDLPPDPARPQPGT